MNFSGTSGDRVLTGVAAGVFFTGQHSTGFNNALKNVAANDQIRAAATERTVDRASRCGCDQGDGDGNRQKAAVAVGQIADRDNSFSVGASSA